jgi:hypothetical protein
MFGLQAMLNPFPNIKCLLVQPSECESAAAKDINALPVDVLAKIRSPLCSYSIDTKLIFLLNI